MLSRYRPEVTTEAGMILGSIHIVDPFQMLRSCMNRHNGMGINPGNKTPYTMHSLRSILNYLQNEYCAKHRHLPVIVHKPVPSVMREESSPRYTQLEVSLPSISLSCLAIRLDI